MATNAAQMVYNYWIGTLRGVCGSVLGPRDVYHPDVLSLINWMGIERGVARILPKEFELVFNQFLKVWRQCG
jgi:hypothetical protein